MLRRVAVHSSAPCLTVISARRKVLLKKWLIALGCIFLPVGASIAAAQNARATPLADITGTLYPEATTIETDGTFVDLLSPLFAHPLGEFEARAFAVKDAPPQVIAAYQTVLDEAGYTSESNAPLSTNEGEITNESLDFIKGTSGGNLYASGPLDEAEIAEIASVAPELAAQLEPQNTLIFLVTGELLSTEITPEMTRWLEQTAIPLTTTNPTVPLDDLAPLADVVSDARIVGLGEATHGTKEFFTMKHRLFRYLVEQKGFTIFAIEAGYAQAERVNDYVRTGEGNAAELVRGMEYQTWAVQEVVDLVEWMKDYNQDPAHPNKLTFAGYDTQTYDLSRQDVLAYLNQVDTPYADEVETAYGCFAGEDQLFETYVLLPDEEQARCHEALKGVLETVQARRDTYIATSSKEAFSNALQNARVIVQAERAFSVYPDFYAQNALRDEAMADNVAWLLEQGNPDAKIALWAHNGHVGTFETPFKTMGTSLRERFGAEMVTIGFDFYTGSFRAAGEDGWNVYEEPLTPPPGTHESFFKSAERPLMFVDLREVPEGGAVNAWFAQKRGLRDIGAGFDQNEQNRLFTPMVLPEAFDVMVYIEQTTAATVLEAASRD